jgi:PhoH-like ATPase
MKTFILDTNVLLHDPEAIDQFPLNSIIIPVTVLEELDSMKRLPNELGRNARAVFRYLDSLQYLNSGNLHTGVTLANGAVVRVQLDRQITPQLLAPSINDNKIIMVAYALHSEGKQVIFVSKDFAARIKAEALGLAVQDYENLNYNYDAIYKGVRRFDLAKVDIDLFYKDGVLPFEAPDLYPNEYCILTSPENTSAVAKYNSKKQVLEALIPPRSLWGLKPRNVEQRIAVDMLMRDDIPLVSLMGPAGTGKTLIALACALHKVFDEGMYQRILVSRPIVPLGRDIGYLPGTKEEKLLPWMQPIRDNLEFLCASSGHRATSETLQWVMSSEKIEMEAVTYIRGRTLPKAYIIVDEAQNLTPHEIKTIISRAGEGTKVVLTGDATQIDNPYLDKDSNGLTYTIGKFKPYPLFGHVFLEKTERSELAALAAAIM